MVPDKIVHPPLGAGDVGGTQGSAPTHPLGACEGQLAVPPTVTVTMPVMHTLPEAPGIGIGLLLVPPGLPLPLLFGQMPKHWQRKPVNKIVAIARNRICPPAEALFREL